jgi:hypothetical protein
MKNVIAERTSLPFGERAERDFASAQDEAYVA